MSKWALFIFLSLAGASAWAQPSCTKSQLRSVPVQDQDGLNICSAMASSILMQLNRGLEKAPSYLQLSLTNGAVTTKYDPSLYRTVGGDPKWLFNESGRVCPVISNARVHGYCDEERLGFYFPTGQDKTYVQDKYLEKVMALLTENQELLEILNRQLNIPMLRFDAINRLAYFFSESDACERGVTSQALCLQEHLTELENYFKNPNCGFGRRPVLSEQLLKTAEQVLDGLTSDHLKTSIVQIIAPGCAKQMARRRNSVDGNKCTETPYVDGKSPRDIVAEELCANRASVLYICAHFMYAAKEADTQKCGDAEIPNHAVPIVAHRTRKDGKRDYLVQNSWGKMCPFTQHKDGKIPKIYEGKVECEMERDLPTGRFWVSEDLLFANTKHINTYRPGVK